MLPRLTTTIKNNINFRFMSSTAEIISSKFPGSTLITLNRPAKLNALTPYMIQTLKSELTHANKEDPDQLIILKGAQPRAFSAGADVASLAKNVLSQGVEVAAPQNYEYFRTEFDLNYLVGTVSNPIVSLWNGIVMGGGAGISAHGKYRVCTETTLFAMPECKIGYFPDVGMLYRLSHLENKPIGLFAALTGHRFKGYEVLKFGLATHYVPSSQIDQLESNLKEKGVSVLSSLNEVGDLTLTDEQVAEVAAAFNASSLDQVIAKLTSSNSEFAQQILKTLSELCPLSLKITFQAFKHAEQMNFEQALNQDNLLAYNLCHNLNFTEGVNALLIEKRAAEWSPINLESITKSQVDEFFKKPEGYTDLKF